MTYALFFLAGVFTVFGLIGAVNFVLYRLALRSVQEDNQKHHEDAVEHWERVEEIWRAIKWTLADKL